MTLAVNVLLVLEKLHAAWNFLQGFDVKDSCTIAVLRCSKNQAAAWET